MLNSYIEWCIYSIWDKISYYSSQNLVKYLLVEIAADDKHFQIVASH